MTRAFASLSETRSLWFVTTVCSPPKDQDPGITMKKKSHIRVNYYVRPKNRGESEREREDCDCVVQDADSAVRVLNAK